MKGEGFLHGWDSAVCIPKVTLKCRCSAGERNGHVGVKP